MIPELVHSLLGRRRVLIAGCGGGYDIIGAVPLVVELRARGVEVQLASFSFTHLKGLEGARQVPEAPNLYEVSGECATETKYCPEAWLSRWLTERFKSRVPVWCFEKTGVRPLLRAYQHLQRVVGFDAIVLIDGGVDSLCRGDESSLGTPTEDLTSLAAVSELDVPTKLLAAVGLGAELRDGICHDQIFQRAAELARAGGHLGTSALVLQSEGGQAYADAVHYLFENQAAQRKSHVHKVVLAALRGEFGPDGPEVWISPLLSQFWFFQLETVVRTHLFLNHLKNTESAWDVQLRIEAARHELPTRGRSVIPI